MWNSEVDPSTFIVNLNANISDQNYRNNTDYVSVSYLHT